MADGEEGQYIHYGQPLEREEDLSRKKAKLAVDQGQARRLPPWKQEVTDAEGRRRFHGAFTGGFSAGYYNTVGSKEGWAPKTFSSSRDRRAETTQQSIDDFLDEDELEEVRLKGLGTSAEYDTFGFTAAEIARRNAEKEVGRRPSAIPGPVPDEIVIPATQSIGVKLLRKMGWRRGRVVGPRHFTDVSAARREGRKAALALASSSHSDDHPKKNYGAQLPSDFVSSGEPIVEEMTKIDEEIDVSENTPDFVLHPKTDVYGLGFDPHKNAPEFKELKHAQNMKDNRIWMPGLVKDSRDAFGGARNVGSQFGGGGVEFFHDDDEVYDTVTGDLEEKDDDAMRVDKPQPRLRSKADCIPGFTPATSSSILVKPARISHPVVPTEFNTRVSFATSLDDERSLCNVEPPEAPPPSDPEMAKLIGGLATFVARIGPRFEELSKEKHAGNPQFSFLFEGPGHEHYKRKIWEEQRNISEKGNKPIEPKRVGQSEKLDAGKRALILGETPLPKEEKARLQEALARNFTSSETQAVDTSQAKLFFRDDARKQERFESYLKERLIGGIKRRSGEVIHMPRAQYELEMCEFDNALRSLETAGSKTALPPQPKEVSELTAMMVSRFTTGAAETISLVTSSELGSSNAHAGLPMDEYPRREEIPWRPTSMLCKRFNLTDPFAGKPALVSKTRSQTDSFVLSLTSVEEGMKHPGPPAISSGSLSTASAANAVANDVTYVEEMRPKEILTGKPVDLYKAIFSDEDDEDEDGDKAINLDLPTSLVVGHEFRPQEVIAKQSEAAEAALNRLAAGDFLESLGKELGLVVPVDKPRVERNTGKGSNRHASSGVGGRPVANVFDKPDSEKNHMNVDQTALVDRAGQREKVSRWAPVDNDAGLKPNRFTEPTDISRGLVAAIELGSKNVEAERRSRKRLHAPSKTSSSQEDSDSESDEKKSTRHSRRSKQDSDSDGDAGRRRSRRHSERSEKDSDKGSDSERRRSKRHSKKLRRAKDEKESTRHNRRRREKHRRKEVRS